MNDSPVGSSFSKLLALCDRPLRVQLAKMFVALFAIAILEFVGIGLFMPLIQLVIDPTRIFEVPIMGPWLDPLRNIEPQHLLSGFSLILFVFFIFKNICMAGLIIWQNRIVSAAHAQLQTRLLDRYMRQPYVFHLTRNSSEFTRTVMVSSGVTVVGVMQMVLNIVTEAILAGSAILLLIVIEPIPSLAVFAFIGTSLALVYMLIRGRLLIHGALFEQYTRRMFQTLNETFGAFKEISILNRTSVFVGTFRQFASARAHSNAARQSAGQMPRLVSEVLVVGALTIVFLLVGSRSSVQDTLPFVGVFAAAGLRILPAVNRITNYMASLRGNIASVENVYLGLYERENDGQMLEVNRAAPLPGKLNELSFQDIEFSYPGAPKSALRSISFSVKSGERVGIVGASSAGKSTLIDILLGLLLPQHGVVSVNGCDIRDNLPNWQARLGYVPQTIYICDDTVRRNVALTTDDKDIRENDVLRAVTLANLTGAVAELPDHLDTVLGEKGMRLSGGQRQRIGIARALYPDPEIIVLDEATSALDNETAREIARTIDEFGGAKTIFVVAHNIDTMMRCERLIFLCEGQLEDIGTFDELRARSEKFRRMTQTVSDDSGVGFVQVGSRG